MSGSSETSWSIYTPWIRRVGRSLVSTFVRVLEHQIVERSSFYSSSFLVLRFWWLPWVANLFPWDWRLNVIDSNVDVIWWYLYIAFLFLLNIGIIVLFLMLESIWSIHFMILIFRSDWKVFLKIWFEQRYFIYCDDRNRSQYINCL